MTGMCASMLDLHVLRCVPGERLRQSADPTPGHVFHGHVPVPAALDRGRLRHARTGAGHRSTDQLQPPPQREAGLAPTVHTLRGQMSYTLL